MTFALLLLPGNPDDPNVLKGDPIEAAVIEAELLDTVEKLGPTLLMPAAMRLQEARRLHLARPEGS